MLFFIVLCFYKYNIIMPLQNCHTHIFCFQNVHDSFKNRSSKGKMTWIEYNGEEIADSELCIDYIKDKFQVDVNSDYAPEQLASGFMVQKMVEDHLYWYCKLFIRHFYFKKYLKHNIPEAPMYILFQHFHWMEILASFWLMATIKWYQSLRTLIKVLISDLEHFA